MENITTTKQYPRSINGRQCITNCYKPKSVILHPTTLNFINDDQPFCAVDEYIIYDKHNNKNISKFHDICNKETTDVQEDIMSLVNPSLNFNSTLFLYTFYNINSFESGLDWITTYTHQNIRTKQRILELILNAYGESITIVDTRFIDVLFEIIKTFYIDEYIDRLIKYIYINDKNEIYIKETAQTNDEKTKVLKMDYIYNYLLNTNNLTTFCVKYFRVKNKNWSSIIYYVNTLISDFLNYLIQKINLTLK